MVFRNKYGLPIITEDGLAMCKHFEGFFPKAYRDPVGVVTIGYGRIRFPSGYKVQMKDTCTKAQAEIWLLEDLESEGAKFVRAYVSGYEQLKPHQISALVDFTFNRGAGRLNEKLDDILEAGLKDRVLDAGEVNLAMATLLSYDWAGKTKKKYEGLARRRAAEHLMFLGKDWRAVGKVSTWRAEYTRALKGKA